METKEIARKSPLAESSFKEALEVLSKRAQFFLDITEYGVLEAQQMAYLAEQGSEAVHSASYRTASQAPTGKLKTEVAKQLAKARLERVNPKKGSGGGRTPPIRNDQKEKSHPAVGVSRDFPLWRRTWTRAGAWHQILKTSPLSLHAHEVWYKGHAIGAF